jgi:hypothetical protein
VKDSTARARRRDCKFNPLDVYGEKLVVDSADHVVQFMPFRRSKIGSEVGDIYAVAEIFRRLFSNRYKVSKDFNFAIFISD